MSKFNFESQVCTDKNQSERLLALGLKKETADVIIPIKFNPDKFPIFVPQDFWISDDPFYRNIREGSIPAWSLGRLLELIKHSDICHYNDFGCIKLYIDLDDFETCITMISYMVKEGYFNKEYLV